MKKYGFTLLEMLIVITIIGILAGLAIPQFTKTIETAKGKEAYVMLETIRTAERMYFLDQGHYTSVVYLTNPFSELVPDYLPEDPNANSDRRNWDYAFVILGDDRVVARRKGGQWEGYDVGMYMNGDMINGYVYSRYWWPWPPN